MKREEFNNLKIGDICVIKRGHDKDNKCMVMFKEDETILIKTLEGSLSAITHSNRKFRLTNMREIDTYSGKDRA